MNVRSLRPFVQPGVEQLRRLYLPFVAIQVVGLAIVLAYSLVPAVERAFDVLTDAKARGGMPFAAAALAFACGIMPEIFKTATGVDRTITRERVSFTLHAVVLFALLGAIQVHFYDVLARAFGESRGTGVVFAKTAIDMMLWSPLFSVPLICFTFTLRKHGYRFAPAFAELGVGWYLRDVVPLLVVNMAYWWPMGLLMYSLPAKMTFVYGVIGSAASSTLMTAIAGSGKPGELEAAVAAIAPQDEPIDAPTR